MTTPAGEGMINIDAALVAADSYQPALEAASSLRYAITNDGETVARILANDCTRFELTHPNFDPDRAESLSPNPVEQSYIRMVGSLLRHTDHGRLIQFDAATDDSFAYQNPSSSNLARQSYYPDHDRQMSDGTVRSVAIQGLLYFIHIHQSGRTE